MPDQQVTSAQHVMTVRGPVDPMSIGFTTMHDHVFWDSASWWAPESFEDQSLTDQPVSMWNAGLARWNALGIRDNLVMENHEYEAQRAELAEFAKAGGTCLVDPTCEGLKPQPLLLRRMSEDLGLHIVAGSGIYVHHSHPDWVHSATLDDITEFVSAQVMRGLEGTDVRPGIIGEVGTSTPVTDCERLVLRASARVGAATGTTVAVHMTTPGQHGAEVVDLMTSEGLDASRIVLCHMDEVLDLDYHLSILRRGATVEFDTFGFDGYFARLWKTPSDKEKMEFLVELVRRGYANQVVVGHDVALKCQLRRFGGLGYDHIPRRIVPTLLNHLGVTRDEVDALVIGNPRRLLTRPGSGYSQN
jgi:phosphotriesterase-related protein